MLRSARGMQRSQLRLNVARFAQRRRAPVPNAARVELPGVVVVGKAALDYVEQLLPQGGLFDRGDELDPAIEVARHHVGGPHQHPRLLPTLEGVDARVLEEAADD